MKLFVRWALNAGAVYLAVYLIPGLVPQNDIWWAYVVFALVLSLLNALLKPLLKLLTCPLVLLTLGLFNLVINTGMLYAANWIGEFFDSGLIIKDFWSALLGAIIISLANVLFDGLVKDSKKKRRKRKKQS